MRPRVVDWSIFLVVTFEVSSGLLSLLVGEPSGRWLFYLHGVGGLALIVLLALKFRRVAPRVTDRSRWEPATFVSVLAAIVVVATIALGVLWSTAQWPVAYPSGMNLHIVLGLLLIPLYLLHMLLRWKPLRRRDLEGRRTVLRALGVLATGAVAWPAQSVLNRVLDAPGADRRFTGSREADSDSGNAFPVTNWMFDDPEPVDRDAWRLRIYGAVERDTVFTYDDLTADRDEQRALLDCTGGWYSVQDWQGLRVGRLLESAGVRSDAIAVSFRSVTGYRWSLPLHEARTALLATHVGGEPLAHQHGAPLRLVAPGRRGFQWVKWVEAIEVLTEPDRGQWAVIFTSGLDG